MFNNSRYGDYYLVNENDMDDFLCEESSEKKFCDKKCILITVGLITSLILIAILLVFVVLPFVFMSSIALQRSLVFTHFNLPTTEEYYETVRLPGYRNKYVTVKDFYSDTNVTLGIWHILPMGLTEEAIQNHTFDYEKALRKSNYSVLLYFHGTGEDRSQSKRTYQLLRYYFHIITFDYRSYADSSRADLSEKAVVNDCVQLYNWLTNQTDSSIYIWGHSLGAALATNVIAHLKDPSPMMPIGLILESPFTSLQDELYVHPYVKFLAWLPWFRYTVTEPLKKNGFIFNTAQNILHVKCPIMLLHAQDDSVVPYKMSETLYKIARSDRIKSSNDTVLHLFNGTLKYDHFSIYEDPYLPFYLMDFMEVCAVRNESVSERQTNIL